jgi:hypothetical protein
MDKNSLTNRERSPWAIIIIVIVLVIFGLFWWWQKKEAEKPTVFPFSYQASSAQPAQVKSDSLDLQISDLQASAVNISIPNFEKAF